MTSNKKEIYAFAISRCVVAPEVLTLDIKSVNFNLNILTTFSKGCKAFQKNVVIGNISGFELSLSISNSIISSPGHAINLTDISAYESVSIHMKNLLVENGDFKFQTRTERCEHMEYIKNTVEMNNIRIGNTGNVALSANGCFNVSIEKLICSNFKWRRQELFTFTGGVLNTKDVLVSNIFADSNMKRNNSEKKALFLIYESVAEIQNMIIKNSAGIRPQGFSTQIIVENSNVKILDMEMEGNSFRNFVRAHKSFLYFENMTLFGNYFEDALCTVEESNLTLYETKFYRNKFRSLTNIHLNSKVLIISSSIIGNKIYKNAYHFGRSHVELNNTNFHSNKIKSFMLAELQSHILIYNLTLTDNHMERITIIFRKSTLKMYNADISRNKFNSHFLRMESNSYALIQNNILTENDDNYSIPSFTCEVFSLSDSSAIQLSNVKIIRNTFRRLLFIRYNSRAIIQNNTLTENNVTLGGYYLYMNCTIQLSNVKFIRNRFGLLLYIACNSSAIIQNNALTENYFRPIGYYVFMNCTIQLSNVKFIRNYFSSAVYYIFSHTTIQLNDVALIKNILKGQLLYMYRNCSAKLINNTIVGNNDLGQIFFAHSSYLGIHTIRIESNTFSQLIWVTECKVSFESMRIRENNVANDMIYIENTDGKLINTYIENCDSFMASAFTITCTYLGNKYYPFEIANIEIIWSYKLQTSARPIIHLSGKVSLSNVKLLVTSLSEIEVLAYTTKDFRLKTGDDKSTIETFFNVYYVKSSFIGCTRANAKYIKKANTFRCIPCERSTYTLNNGSLHLSSSIQSNKTIMPENVTNFTCLDCPVGANCASSIKSRSHFYGYETKEQRIKFLPCPRGFCCTGSQCTTTKSCNKNRVGTLCGRCIDSYKESFISASCISIHSCQNFGIFWLVYCTYSLILATFFYYMKDFIIWIKTVGSITGKIFQPCLKEEGSEGEIDVTIGIAEAEENLDKISHFTVSGIPNLIVSFYQIKQLMNVDVQYNISNDFSFITFISDFLNLEIVTVTYSSYCPMSNLDAVSKIFIKTYFLTATLLIASLINYFMSRVFHSFRPSLRRGSSLNLSDRLGVCFIRTLMFSYKNIASASLIFLNCVEVAGVRVLFIKGDMECYQWWQIVIAVFLFTWVLFFPLSLKISFNMFMKDKISFPKFILCLMAPFVLVAHCFLNRHVVSVNLQKRRSLSELEVKKILREIFEESYRIKTEDSREETVFYETWRLYHRVLLAFVATFYINPIVRITFMTPTVILIAVSYFVIRPYKPEMYVLRWMEAFSVLGYFVCLGQSMFRSFLYVYDINDEDSIKLVWQVFSILDLIFSPVLMLIYFFLIKPIYSKGKCKIISLYLTVRRRYGRTFF